MPHGIGERPVRWNLTKSDHVPFVCLVVIVVLKPNQTLCWYLKPFRDLEDNIFDAVSDASTRVSLNCNASDHDTPVGKVDAFDEANTISIGGLVRKDFRLVCYLP